VVSAAPERAFELFARELGRWWPAEYTWAADGLEEIAIEPRVDGRCFERGPRGFECDWGRVLAWEPGAGLAFSWQIAPDRVPVPDSDRASEVEVRFSDAGRDATRVNLEHRGFERHGEGGAGYRAGMASERGWPYILARYAEFAGAPGGEASA
jgi:uncharacterized protein YndB with AHSA1/START domain